MKIHTELVPYCNILQHALGNFRKIKLLFLSHQPAVMENEDVSIFKLIQEKLGIKAIRYLSCPHAAIKPHFS